MNRRRNVTLLIGVVSGIIGAAVFGLALANVGMMSGIAGVFHLQGDAVGWLLHLALGGIIGALYALWYPLLAGPSRLADSAASGALYGFVWWCLGEMTFVPLLRDGRVAWTMAAAADAFPALIGHIVFGLITGVVFQLLSAVVLPRIPVPIQAASGTRTRIVILGSGFSGMGAAVTWEKHLLHHPEIDVTLVSDNNYSLFTPMLAEVASGALEAPHISSSVRSFFRRVHFRRAAVSAVDTANRTVTIKPCETCQSVTLPYDHLLVGLGTIPFDFGLPGIGDYSYTLKTLQDAVLLRDHVLTLLETADALDTEIPPDLLTFVVAGGGFSGMEIVAELFDFVHGSLRYYPNVRREQTRFVLVHSGEHVLPELSVGLGDYAQRKLAARGIEFKMGVRVSGCTSESVLFNKGDLIPAQTLVWTTGNRTHPIVEALGVTKNNNRIQTEPTLRSVSNPEIWSVGDCAWNPDPAGKPYAPTAQNASRSGKKAAENMLAALESKPLEPFVFKPLGLLVVLGRRTAAAEVGSWQFSGLLAWMMWRSIYLSKLPGMEKKIRVGLDWFVEFFFPRDVVLTQRVFSLDQAERGPARAAAPAPTETAAAQEGMPR